MKPEYAEVLRWIADGKKVQIRPKYGAWVHPSVLRLMEVVCQNLYDDFENKEPTYEFRLKPEKKWFRVYLDPHGLTHTLDSCEGAAEAATSEHSHFVRWLTDRIYYE
jgi:hypothetical protein